MITHQPTKYVLPAIKDLDEHYSRTPNTILFNDLMIDRTPEEIVDLLCDISEDKTDSVASCDCGHLIGNYYEDIKCRKCGTHCKSSLFKEIRNDAWLEIPSIIKGVLNPQVYRIISDWIGKFNRKPILAQILNMNEPREPITGTPFFTGMGFNWFYDNFDAFINFYLASHPTETGRSVAPDMQRFLESTGKAIWCTKLPILSKYIQPVAKASATVRYADEDIENLFKAIFSFRSILLAERMMKFSADHIDKHFFRVYGEFITYTDNILVFKLPKKHSVMRKHVFGSRYHCTCRTVAVPITDPHDCDEIFLPWKLGIMVYKYHIISVLVNKRGLSVFEAYNKVMDAINIYDHQIDIIMQELIAECPYKGLPMLMNRNPSLKIGSIQLLFVTKIKPAFKNNPFPNTIKPQSELISLTEVTDDDPFVISGSMFDDINTSDPSDYTNSEIIRAIEDSTIEISPLVVVAPNLDF